MYAANNWNRAVDVFLHSNGNKSVTHIKTGKIECTYAAGSDSCNVASIRNTGLKILF